MSYPQTPTRNGKRVLSLVAMTVSVLIGSQFSAADTGPGSMLLIKNAQQGAVRSFATDSVSKTVFIGSDDGSVQVWQGDKPELIQRLQVSNQPILKLASGTGDTLAVVERGAGTSYKVSMWDWKPGHERFVIDINEQPLWLSVSPKGSFILMGLARPDSLAYFDAKTGAALNWPKQMSGIIDYALISSREERVMTYHAPSGTIAYTDIASGNLVAKFASRPNLKSFQVLPDGSRTKAVAVDNQNVVLVDLVNGAVLGSTALAIIPQWLAADETKPDHAYAAVAASDGIRIQPVILHGTTLNAQPAEKTVLADVASAWTPFLGRNLAGDAGGQSWRFPANDDPKKPVVEAFAEKRQARAVGVAFAGNSLYVTTQSGMLRLEGDLFLNRIGDTIAPTPSIGAPATTGTPGTQRLSARGIAVPAPVLGLGALSDGSLLLWDRDRNPKLYRFDTKSDSVVRTGSSVSNAFVRVFADKANVLTVESNGFLRTWTLVDFKQTNFQNSLGNLSGGILSDGAILIGKGASNESPLVRLVPKTGETVAIPSNDTAVYLMRANTFDNDFYYLSTVSKNRESLTFLKRLEGTGPTATSTVIASFSGEDIDADIAFAPNGPQLYTSAGSRNVSVWDGRKLSSLEETNRVPRQLAVGQRIVAAVNLDGSLSLWNAQSAAHICDIVLLDSGVILALTKKAEYYVLARTLGTARNTEAQFIAADTGLAEALIGLSTSARAAGINAPVKLSLAPAIQ